MKKDSPSKHATITAVCPNCQTQFSNIKPDWIGRKAKCKKCGTKFKIESEVGGPEKTPEASPGSPPAPKEDGWAIGRTVMDLYDITDLLGKGGMGAVHRVHHRGWNMDLAVKSPLGQIMEKKGGPESFEREAETWVNLPLHPHIVSCYYVRRIFDVPRVFVEFISGGSLADWINDRTLYEGGPEETQKRILDVAIQFAWGLDFAHEQGLIHQDVKPGNLMLTPEGIVKVTDFGLARADIVETGGDGESGPQKTMMVNKVGMTPAYASPEQASGEVLTRRTDLWSWAVSVLEMFTSEVTWPVGVAAGYALETYLAGHSENDDFDEDEHDGDDLDLPTMPEKLGSFLRECFKQNPDDRPHNLGEVADRLIEIYRETTGEGYHRHKPKAGRDTAAALNNRALSLLDLGQKDEALTVLDQALKVEPHHPEATYNRGLIRWRTGDITDLKLVDELEEVRKSHEETWVDEYYLGLVHMERGDFEAADRVLETIEDDGAAPPEITEALAICRRKSSEFPKSEHTLKGGTSGIYKARFSGDGKSVILAGNKDNSAYVIDTENGGQAAKLEGHEKPVTSVWLTPDGRYAVTGSSDRTVRLWEVASGSSRVLGNHEGTSYDNQGVNALYLSRNGRWLLSGGLHTIVKKWDTATGQRLAEFTYPDGDRAFHWVTDLDVNEKYNLMVVSDNQGHIHFWNMKTESLLKTITVSDNEVSCLGLSPDCRFLLSGCQGNITLWDVKSGAMLFKKPAHRDRMLFCRFSPCGYFGLTGGEAEGMKIWDIGAGRCVRSSSLGDFHQKAHAGHFLGERPPYSMQQIAWLTIETWGFESLPAPMMLSRIMASEETILHSAKYEKHIQAAREAMSAGDYVTAWREVEKAREESGHSRGREAMDIAGELYIRFPHKTLRGGWEVGSVQVNDNPSGTISLGPDDQWVVTTDKDSMGRSTMKRWDAQTLKPLKPFSSPQFGNSMVHFTPDGTYVLTSGSSAPVGIWDTATGRKLHTLKKCPWPAGAAVSPNGRHFFGILDVFSGEKVENGSVAMWEVRTGQRLRTFPPESEKQQALAISPDGLYLLLPNGKGEVVFLDVETGKRVAVKKIPCQKPGSLRFRQDGSLLLTSSKTIYIWDYRSNSSRDNSELDTYFNKMRLTHDGRFALLSMGKRGLMFLDLDTYKEPRTLGGSVSVVDAAATRDGRYAYTLTVDGLLKKWELDWDLEPGAPVDWDVGALPILVNFLNMHPPSTSPAPPKRKPKKKRKALFKLRDNETPWTEADFQGLIKQLQYAGFGRLRAEGVKQKLDELTANWTGPIDLWEM